MLRGLIDRLAYLLASGGRTLLRLLPLRAGLALGAFTGRALARLGGPRVAVARENIRATFPDWSERRRRELLESSYASIGRMLFEAAQLHTLTAESVARLVRIEGAEHIEAARKRSATGGVILLTAHFGSFELMAVACALRGFPVAIVHRTVRNGRLDRLVTEWRERAGVQVLRRGSAARGALRALRDGRLLAMPLDQNASRRDGIFVPFLGRNACTRDGPARLAMRFGTPVVPVFIFREGDGPRHTVRAAPPLELEPAGADGDAAVRRNVIRMNRAIEAAIHEAPDHWIWIHRRWKTQPKPKRAAHGGPGPGARSREAGP